MRIHGFDNRILEAVFSPVASVYCDFSHFISFIFDDESRQSRSPSFILVCGRHPVRAKSFSFDKINRSLVSESWETSIVPGAPDRASAMSTKEPMLTPTPEDTFVIS